MMLESTAKRVTEEGPRQIQDKEKEGIQTISRLCVKWLPESFLLSKILLCCFPLVPSVSRSLRTLQ
jgi:hypothetical protein